MIAGSVLCASTVLVLAGCSSAGEASTHKTTATTTVTLAPISESIVRQPAAVALPTLPDGGISWGSHGGIVLAYQRRLKQLHFDPGPVDGIYGQNTQYAITTVDKLFGLARDGVINTKVQRALERFAYRPAMPNAEGARVEVDLDTQTLVVYENWQPILVTTASTGSGEYFCGGTDGCQYAITPAGHFHFQFLHRGWDQGKLGRMWNPYYFDGGIAVHGLASVPAYPASHGCVRIPMRVANYFPTLVSNDESMYVVGRAKQPGLRYVGPTTTTTSTISTTTSLSPPSATTTTIPQASTSVPNTTVTRAKPAPTAMPS
jgi:peptidoglycan hydrolase-like protein with peptidoglycan-binding domain